MASLSKIYEQNLDREFQVKLAAVTEQYQEDADRVRLLDEAVNLIKEAQEAGSLSSDMHPSDVLTLAVQIVEDEMSETPSEQEKVAEAQNAEDTVGSEEEELSKEAAEQVADIGEAVGYILAERGITVDDLEKIASEEEVEELGRYCAQVYAELVSEDQ